MDDEDYEYGNENHWDGQMTYVYIGETRWNGDDGDKNKHIVVVVVVVVGESVTKIKEGSLEDC